MQPATFSSSAWGWVLGVNQCYFPYAGHESAHYGTDSSGNPLLDRKTFPFYDIVHCMMIVLMERIPVAWWATWVTGEGGLIDTAYSVRNVHYAPSGRKELVPRLKRVLIKSKSVGKFQLNRN